MARIRKEDHPRILRMADVEHRKVPDIATEFGCTPAAIYALLGKLRRQSTEVDKRTPQAQAPLALVDDPPSPPVPAAAPVDPVPPSASIPSPPNVVVLERTDPVAAPREPHAAAPPVPAPRPPSVQPPRRPAPGVRLAKQGYGLVMRTSDGEESVAPFRSLDDLLSAVKPILRATATSAEPVWFSLQPIDLATLDMDAA